MEEVKRALTQLSNKIDQDYMPLRRVELVGHRAAGYHVDMEQMEREMATDPKNDLKFRLQRLTYGDMMEVCGGILATTAGKHITTKEELAKVIDQWAASHDPKDAQPQN